MSSVSVRSKKSDRKAPVPQQQPTEPPGEKPHALLLSPSDDMHVLIAKRAYNLHGERGYRHGSALDDWLEAEREIHSQIPPV
jgi:hypothetical protein